jgi:hypothetical protein
MGSINNNLSSSYLQSVISGALQGTALSNPPKSHQLNAVDPASLSSGDNGQISPFAQILSQLQQLQQSNPAQYQQVTQQISTNLLSAAQTAQASGNTTAANTLTQLATDFSNASKSGQLPNIQDLAQAVAGHHHHHHGGHGHAAPPVGSTDADGDNSSVTSSSSSGSSSSGSTSSSASQTASQLVTDFLANAKPSNALNPVGIILTTLSAAGITGSTGA